MIQTRKHLVLGLTSLALALGACALTKADTLVLPTQSFGPSVTELVGTFNFAQFDTLGGTRVLNSVKVDLATSFSTTITVTNSGGTASTGTARTEVQDGLTDGTFSIGAGNVLTITGANYAVQSDIFSPPQAYSLGAGQSTALAPTSGSASNTGTFSSGAVLTEFTGLGTVGVKYDTLTQTVLANTGGNTDASQVTNATLSATITYNFTTVVTGTPEPGSVAMFFGMGVTGMAFIYRRRIKK